MAGTVGANGVVNPNNNTGDPRVIWEDGLWAIIEAGDWPPGIARSKTRDSGDIQGTLGAAWEPGLATVPIGPQSIAQKKWVKVKLLDFMTAPKAKTIQQTVQPGMFRPLQDPKTPVAPPSPFMPKPYKVVPDWPHLCQTCGGRFVQLANSSIHELTEFDPVLRGKCPGAAAAKKMLSAKATAAQKTRP